MAGVKFIYYGEGKGEQFEQDRRTIDSAAIVFVQDTNRIYTHNVPFSSMVQVVDTLESDSSTAALSAAKGKELSGKIAQYKVTDVKEGSGISIENDGNSDNKIISVKVKENSSIAVTEDGELDVV